MLENIKYLIAKDISFAPREKVYYVRCDRCGFTVQSPDKDEVKKEMKKHLRYFTTVKKILCNSCLLKEINKQLESLGNEKEKTNSDNE